MPTDAKIRIVGPTQKYRVIRGPGKFTLLSHLVEPFVHRRLRRVKFTIQPINGRGNPCGRHETYEGDVVSYSPFLGPDSEMPSSNCATVVIRVLPTAGPHMNYLLIEEYDLHKHRSASARFLANRPGTIGEFNENRWYMATGGMDAISVRAGLGLWEIMNSLGNPHVGGGLRHGQSLRLGIRLPERMTEVTMLDPLTQVSGKITNTTEVSILRCDRVDIQDVAEFHLEVVEVETGVLLHVVYTAKTGRALIAVGPAWNPQDPY